jgi:hypothetical protein
MTALIQGRHSRAFVLEHHSEAMLLIYQKWDGREAIFRKGLLLAVSGRLRMSASGRKQSFPDVRFWP